MNFFNLGASIDRPDRSPVAEESETNVDMCPNPTEESKGPKLKKMLSLEGGKEGIKQMKKVKLVLSYLDCTVISALVRDFN